MDINIGLKAEKAELVTQNNTARNYGSGSIDVYATPAMIALMEGASLNAVSSALPAGFTTVGTKLDVKHLSATPVGMIVKAGAELIEVTGKKLTFKVFASDEKGKIGEGLHERYIIEIETFLNKAKNK